MTQPPETGAGDRDLSAGLRLVQQFQSAVQRDSRGSIVEVGRKLLALRSPLGAQWLSVAGALAANGEISLARRAADLYVEDNAEDPAAPYKKAALLSQIGDWGAAIELLRTLPPTQPDPASYAYTRGTAALYLGERDEARTYLDASIRAHPHAGSPWLSLAFLIDFADEPDFAGRIEAAEQQMQGAVPSERAAYYYALGKARADCGDHARAFAACSTGARLMRPLITYSRLHDRTGAAEAVDGYDPARLAALARHQSQPTCRTIFVTGLPRSGTTLVEQILTSHSAVSGGGEIYLLHLLRKEVGGTAHAMTARFAESGRAPGAAELWDHWLADRFPQPGLVVDKSLTTSRMLGLAAALLPEAPLIWLTRDPLDRAWSCFRLRFLGEPWSYDLKDIAYHFRLEDQLLATWQDLLGERLLVVPYEELASHPEPWIRRILAHCGLAEEPQAFAPHENARPVTTSSTMQVRRPINRAGIGSAEPYREFLQPFVDAYYG